MQASNRSILNEIASSRGLPSYEQFHHENGVAYNIQSRQGSLGVERFMQPSRQSDGYIEEDYGQIQRNLSYVQKPVTLAEQLRYQQAELFARQAEEARQAAYQEFQHQQWAKQKAAELRQLAQANRQLALKAQVTKSQLDALIEQAFHDPANPEQSIIEQGNGPERLPDGKLSQAELNLDNMLAKGRISKAEYQELAVIVKAVAARNWLQHDGKANKDGTVTYRGVIVDQKVASLVAYADSKRYWDKDVHLSAQELGKAAFEFAKGTYDFFIGDDIKTLSNPNAPILAKVLSGGSLALMVLPGAAIGRTTGKAVLKATATQVLERNAAWIGAGLFGTAAAGAGVYALDEDWLREVVDPFIPQKYQSKSKTEHNPNEERCYALYYEDLAWCSYKFPDNPVRYKRCERTAEIRHGECRATGKRKTPLDTWPD